MLPHYLEPAAIAWGALAIVVAVFSCAAAVFHLRPVSSESRVVRYEPPAGISPGLAAYLRQNGRCERAFAAGIVSLAEQCQLSIEPIESSFRLTKLCPAAPPSAKEEAALVKLLFGESSEWCDDRPLRSLAEDFQQELDKIACPEFLSPHSKLWLAGTIACTAAIPLLFVLDQGSHAGDFSLGFIVYSSIFIGLGVLSLTAALRAWPATLRKLWSEFPGATASRLRFTINDLTPLFLTSSALIGFGLLAFITSLQVSTFVALVVIVSFAFRHLLEAPSRKGREVLAQLEEFREFLSRTDSDRLSRQDPRASHSPEKYGAYAVALGVEKGWREQFTSVLLERIEFERVCDAGNEMVGPPSIRTHKGSSAEQKQGAFIELNLHGPK
jgi:hypothetical protein